MRKYIIEYNTRSTSPATFICSSEGNTQREVIKKLRESLQWAGIRLGEIVSIRIDK